MKRQHPTDPEWNCSRCGKHFIPNNKIREQAIRRSSQFVYCSRECLNNRKLHPQDGNLFFCFHCQTYKHRTDYYTEKRSKYGITPYCTECHGQMQGQYRDTDTSRARRRESERERWARMSREDRALLRRKQYQNNRPNRVKSAVSYIKKRRASDPIWAAKQRKHYKARIVADLRDCYIRDILRLGGIQATPETIELKRQQIIMKRTLKEFKKWREEREDESGHANVQGE